MVVVLNFICELGWIRIRQLDLHLLFLFFFRSYFFRSGRLWLLLRGCGRDWSDIYLSFLSLCEVDTSLTLTLVLDTDQSHSNCVVCWRDDVCLRHWQLFVC